MRDMMLFGGSDTEKCAELIEWFSKSGLHKTMPDYHRLQLERWIWDRRLVLKSGRTLDVGAIMPRRWLGDNYVTFGLQDCDILGDLLAMPFDDEAFDCIILTEVLEHCVNPFVAVKEVYRVLKKAGLLLVTSPFFWPWHGTQDYADYWRFTDDAWRLLLREFIDVKIRACEWTVEGEQFYDYLRRFECMGLREHTRATTGYLVEALK